MKKAIFIILVVLFFTSWGCVKKEKVALKIGDIEFTTEEYDEAFKSSGSFEYDDDQRKEFLDRFISRKLILKEAEKMGLDKDPQFLQSIQLFWEQSLLKLVLSRKMKELSVEIKVGDSQISDFYNNRKEQVYADKELSEVYDQIKLLLFKAKQGEAIQDWVSSLRNKTKVEINYQLLGIKENK